MSPLPVLVLHGAMMEDESSDEQDRGTAALDRRRQIQSNACERLPQCGHQ